jgi:assimilatory nitrate reductase catalytic subunit
MNSTLPRKNSLLRRWDGPMTSDLTLRPADFGLGKVPDRLLPDATTTSVCGFCSTGCGLKIHLRDNQAVNLSADDSHPVNLGMACPKGWEALTPLSAPDRATTPLLRHPETGAMEAVDWDHALQVFTLKFKALIDQHGPESVAWLGTGQITTEELAWLGALAKFGMGIRHGDGNTRQCMATSVVAYRESFGFDAPPYTYADFEQGDVIVLIGSNLCITHPILWQRVMRNRNSPEIIVMDPRLTETAMCATQHLALKPKSDLVLLYGMAHLLIENGGVNQEFIDAHTSHFEAFKDFVREFTPDRVAAESGLTVGRIFRCVEAIRRGKAVSFWWTMGVNQGHEATRTAQAIINLALMTGNIGRPGTGANSVTGQCNAMGSRLFSNTGNLLGGHDFKNLEHRVKIARTLGIPVGRIPVQPSRSYDQILDGIDRGEIKGLWVVATNTAHSWINQHSIPELFRKLEFLVVQDMYSTTETSKMADLLLPAAGWGEKDGTFINSERRIGVVKKVSRAPGEALADFHIFQLIAQYWGCGEMFARWTSPQAVFELLKECSQGQPCDITGIGDYRMIDECGGIQWPFPAAVGNRSPQPTDPSLTAGTTGQSPALRFTVGAQIHEGQGFSRERRLFEDGRFFTPDGRARFVFEPPRPLPEATDAEYPFTLLTGRGTSAQWHTQTRTSKSALLRQLYPANAYIEINPRDAVRLRVRANEKVEVTSRRGVLVASAHITATVSAGQVFIPMHYTETNRLTFPAFDPHSRQPSYKHCAVRIRPLAEPQKKATQNGNGNH